MRTRDEYEMDRINRRGPTPISYYEGFDIDVERALADFAATTGPSSDDTQKKQPSSE